MATEVDLAEAERWLKAEYEDAGEGFWCNWRIIAKGQNEGNLYVAVDDSTDLPIALLLNGRIGPDILSVRVDHRGRGAGRRLAEFAIALLREQDACVVEIECAPRTSIPFWRRMGFTPYAGNRAYMLLGKSSRLPQGAPAADVRIAFYPESAKWQKDVEPLMVATPQAVRESVVSLGLAERVVLFTGERPDAVDLVVSITVDGTELYRGKAKYPEAGALGVIRDSYVFYIDEIVVTEEEIAAARARAA
ncbi:GNAT family N-acetyltransferase [Azospirillum sp. HJ39]|uniref:GNAT family N-acetyltransferase n=1 Tax=Azospirillum sp. HJ39 TaxID=3159496 RepID=UPI0035584BB8